MTSLWLIANSASRSTSETVIAGTRALIEGRGVTVTRLIDLSEEDMPEGEGDLPDIIACLGGDGTANAVIDRYGANDGPRLLILPGGTMNLLATELHGQDATPEAIVERALPEGPTIQLPQIEGPDFRALTGIIAGPTTAWGEVREKLREGAIAELAELVPAALDATFEGEPIHLSGLPGGHTALFIEPNERGLAAHDIQTQSLADLARHGWAWLRRDFLGGPTEMIALGPRLTLEDEQGPIDILVDGERVPATSPLTLRWGRCPARFIATRES